jgi:hypothetical protein
MSVRTMGFCPFQIGGRLGFEYLDANDASHLYGVQQGEATPARNAYAPGDTRTPRLELSTAIPATSVSTHNG